jgi:hypothetical protein
MVRGTAQPTWLTVHGEQRTRYETSDGRYRLGESGGDQQLSFRTRLRANIDYRHWLLTGEIQDARASLTDSGSTVNTNHVTRTRLLQGHGGYLFSFREWKLTAEAGRFTMDLGGRRLIGRNNFRNTTNAFDGVLVKLQDPSAKFTLQAFDYRPVIYTYPQIQFDTRYRDDRLKGLFLNGVVQTNVAFDAYVLHMNDGTFAPQATRRNFYAAGGRLFHNGEAWSYETEAIWQFGTAGPLDHRAHLFHAQAAKHWSLPLSPQLTLYYDYASGDKNPTDRQNNAFDSLYGPRSFEFGPTGTWGIFARSNLNSPAAQILIRPTKQWDFLVRHRLLNMAQSRDQWRGVGLVDASGRSGTYVGQQTEFRFRYHPRKFFELDTGYTAFREGSFVQSVRHEAVRGWAHFLFVATDWHF